jgi:hypothetical protein
VSLNFGFVSATALFGPDPVHTLTGLPRLCWRQSRRTLEYLWLPTLGTESIRPVLSLVVPQVWVRRAAWSPNFFSCATRRSDVRVSKE